MSRGRYPGDRNRDLMNVAAAVVGSAAAAQVVHRETVNSLDLTSSWPPDRRWVSRSFGEADHSHHTHASEADCQCVCDGEVTRRACMEHGENAYRYTAPDRVIDAAREYARTGGEAHHELMDAVAALERAERGE